MVGRRTSEGDFTYSSVAVDRDGSRLEHRGNKDFPWHLTCRPTGWNVRNQAIYEKIPAEIRDAGYEHACSEIQRQLEAVKPDKEPWRSPAS